MKATVCVQFLVIFCFFIPTIISTHPFILIWNVKLQGCPTVVRSWTCSISHAFDLKIGWKVLIFTRFPSKLRNIGSEGLSELWMKLNMSQSTFWALKHKFRPWYMLRINLKNFLENRIFVEISTPKSIFVRSKKTWESYLPDWFWRLFWLQRSLENFLCMIW